MKPPVSVLMAVFNAEKYVAAAIDSMLSQSFRDFEFIIIDDASRDQSVRIINAYQDERIRLIRNKKNLGLTRSLNKALDLAQGRYIARMDADDISAPTRLEKQVAFMENHPEVGVCGSWAYYLRAEGDQELWRYPERDEVIRTELLLKNRLAHPSVMIRCSVMDEHQLRYNPNYYTSQDYELWVRMSRYCQLANLPEPLITYRHHAQRVSSTKRRLQRKNTHQVRLYQLEQLGIRPTWIEWKSHLELIEQRTVRSAKALKKREQWLTTLLRANQHSQRYAPEEFYSFLTRQWHLSIGQVNTYNVKIFYLCLVSRFPFFAALKKSQALHFLVRCIRGSLK